MKIILKLKNEKIKISTEFIRLDSFMKLCGCVLSGGQAKGEIQAGNVKVDGEVCTMRGKKLRPGQRVEFEGKGYEVEAQ